MLDALIERMAEALHEMETWPDRRVQLYHHNDADGLSSGAILTRAFERQGYGVERFCLEKPYPPVLERIYGQEGRILLFADFAGRIAPLLSDLNQGRNLTLILDHHAAEPAHDPRVYNLDPELYGLKGDRDISASTTCYLFARTLNAANRDLARVAVLGAVGDRFFVDGRLVSQNREVALEAVDRGLLEIREEEGGEIYFLREADGRVPCHVLADDVETLGAVGYYEDGPDLGVRVCLEGCFPEARRRMEHYRRIRDERFDRERATLRDGAWKVTPHIQWFDVGGRFAPMGVKMIGVFCETLIATGEVDPGRYVAGFQRLPDDIPGFGRVDFNQVKVSMRVSPQMEREVRAGRAMTLDVLLPEATRRLGGFADACHSLTAATTVAVGRERQLIDEMERLLASGQEAQ